MVIPSLRPPLRVLIDIGQEEMVQEPDVCGDGWIEAVVSFKFDEEVFPLRTEAMGHVIPQTLDTGVVHAPG